MAQGPSDAIRQALAFQQAGKLRESEIVCRQMLAANPKDPDALNLLGVIAGQVGQYAAAEQLIRQSLAVRYAPQALNNLGIVLRFAGRKDDAIAAYREALKLDADDPKIHANLGTTLRELGRFDEALVSLQRSIELDPNAPLAHTLLGNLYLDLRRTDEAIASYERAVTLEPRFAEAYSNLGNGYGQAGRYADAVAAIAKCIALKPQWPDAYVNLSDALRHLGRLEESVNAAQKALDLQPQSAASRVNLGNALISQGRVEEAIVAWRAAADIAPQWGAAASNVLLALHNREEDPHKLFDEHRRWADRFIAPVEATATPPSARVHGGDRRIRIGYVSSDLRRHPVGRFMLPILEHHDRERFEVVCYSGVGNPDEVTMSLRSHCDAWHDVAPLSDERLAALIREHAIDILVDLAGHTAGGRLYTFARKPAPVQVTYLGYPDTTALRAMDYRITDAIADPVGASEQFNTETLSRIDGCFLSLRLPEQGPRNPEAPDARVRFGCFNNFTKVSPHIVKLWARILNEATDARLLLRSRGLSDPATARRILDMLASHDGPIDRIDLLGHEESNHLDRYNTIDIALDTFPYSGTSTTCDALSMGAPVVTLQGRTHASRVSASLLTAAGVPQWIATNDDHYVKLAVELAKQGCRTVEQRRSLRDQVAQSMLCDERNFVRKLEVAYAEMWAKPAGKT